MGQAIFHKGYQAEVAHDPEAGILYGRVRGIRDGVGFHAETWEALRVAFAEAVEDYIETCRRIGKAPETPSPLQP